MFDDTDGLSHKRNGWLECRVFAPYALLTERAAGLRTQVADLKALVGSGAGACTLEYTAAAAILSQDGRLR
eukprot:SAG22_NODE_74_length_22289_cov_65.265119_15_plen_71_part_00